LLDFYILSILNQEQNLMETIAKLSEIKERFKDLITHQVGADQEIQRISRVEDCKPGDLVFLDHKRFVESALAGKPSGVVISEDLLDKFPPSDQMGILVSNNVKMAHALLKQAYGDRNYLNEQWVHLEKSSTIHPSAKIPDSSFIGPRVVIGKDAILGENCQIFPGVIIENGAKIGNHCVIHPNAVIGYNCILGNNVIIGAGTVIGSEGYGFAQDQDRKSHRIPQTGIVEIKDDVRIGGNNVIDRATYGSTLIGRGTKMDNMIHIGHNAEIGEDCLLLAHLCMAGSTKLGNRVWTSGHTGILDHLNICDDSIFVHMTGVAKDINEPGMYGGMPLQPIKKYFKNANHIKNLTEFNKRIRELEKQVESLQSK